MKQRSGSPLGLYTIGIAALFLAGFLLLVVFGAQSYRNTVTDQDGNMRSRALLSYLSTTLHAYDGADAVSRADSDYGPVLVVADGGTGYALRIYRYEGHLVEDYARRDAELLPEEAQVIGDTERFDFLREGDLLTVTTDAGQVLYHIRGEEAAP